MADADLDALDAALGELRAAGWPAPEDPDSDEDTDLDGRDHLRSPSQFERFFEGLELVEPGVVPVPHWRPGPGAEPGGIYSYCGVGRKP